MGWLILVTFCSNVQEYLIDWSLIMPYLTQATGWGHLNCTDCNYLSILRAFYILTLGAMIPVDARQFNCVDHVLYYFKVGRKAEIYCIYFQSVLRPSCKLSDTSTLWLICNYLFLLLQSCLFHLFCLPFGSALQAFTLIVPISIVRASPES